MGEEEDMRDSDGAARFQKSTETLSVFVARVLNQLSLSAWLPSGALVLVLDFIFQLGAALDIRGTPNGPENAIGSAFSAMARTSLGGAILLFAAVIILTTLTQAFVFEAIRLLEGYWGTSPMVERLAKRRCTHFQNEAMKLKRHRDEITKEAWSKVREKVKKKQAKALSGDEAMKWTQNMLRYYGHIARGLPVPVQLSRDELNRGRSWEQYAPADLLRRRMNLTIRLGDFPTDFRRIRPTRLGNVLRAYEDLTHWEPVETFVLKHIGELPQDLRIQHDQRRNQLDLYCSMVFVADLVIVFAAVRLGPSSWPYAVVAVAVGVAGMWFAYRAAIASARLYGKVLLTIADYLKKPYRSDTAKT